MEGPSKGRAAVKFGFWTILAAAMFVLVAHLHMSGRFARWYYFKASADGYAVNADSFKNANEKEPAYLEIGKFERIEGLQAVEVKKGDRLPELANGIIGKDVLEKGERAALEGTRIKVIKPFKIEDAKGFKFKNTFKHKGVKTDPWAAPINVFLVIGLGLTLGFMAEGFTDLIGIKVEKIHHFEGH
jgi:hypothetical protein